MQYGFETKAGCEDVSLGLALFVRNWVTRECEVRTILRVPSLEPAEPRLSRGRAWADGLRLWLHLLEPKTGRAGPSRAWQNTSSGPAKFPWSFGIYSPVLSDRSKQTYN